LHVLGTPPAFVLSQDQTLHKRKFDKAQIFAGINFDVQNFVSSLNETLFINVLLFSFQGSYMERVMRIELTTSAWKAEVLPLNYTRLLK
jgi:hypothetical protein